MVAPLDLLLRHGVRGPGVSGPAARQDRITHVEHLPARTGQTAAWPSWVDHDLRSALEGSGIAQPWTHQAAAADLAWSGHSVVVSTGTASGKSLCYLLPALTAAIAQTGTTVYLAPTKALAADQLRAIGQLRLAGVRAATYDGDTPPEERDWARRHADVLLTNPDMLHHGLLPSHARWATTIRKLRFVVVDECHHYRGVFGSHVAQVLRRLRRIARHYGADPVFVLASATVSDPGSTALRLTGAPAEEVVDDGSPRGAVDVALWEPPLSAAGGENGAPVRRPATAEAATILADLVVEGVRTVAFVRSRRGAESVSLGARRALEEAAPELVRRVAAYRAGYLAEDRRALERALHDGDLLGLASTNALELGVDVSGLDAVLIAGWPGTHASLWQQAGRAGRAGRDALAVLIARDDPLDTYLIHHPAAVFGRPVEAAVLDPDNPHVLRPHLAAAAAELPLSDADAAGFGPQAIPILDALVAEGLLRRRANGWYWTARERATDLADLRGTGGPPVRICEVDTGRLLGTVDAAASHATVHPGAVYLHQGATYVVRQLDLDASVALVEADNPDWTTSARDVTDIRVVEAQRALRFDGVELHFGQVDVTSQIVSFLRRRLGSGEVLGEEPLDLPARELRTQATWWTVSDELLAAAAVETRDLPGAAHAAEHASIGLLPLVATCDRWDIGGMSTALHPDTGAPTVFVYDGHAGGAGFAERAYDRAEEWLTATRDAIDACECAAGCPSCVQSPKCGNGNEPLDKAGAVRLLSAVVGRCWGEAAG
ncbi:MAG TPA: DEAD/DEAH box helicase [Mycobacteriales bacterium]|nr:DEAD/DEAH box helicase [Mycobacteriales bacterium]